MAKSKIEQVGQYTVDLNHGLGSGTFGEVFLGKAKKDGYNVAVKRIKYRDDGDFMNKEMVKMARTEVQSAMSLNGHPNVIEFLDHTDDGLAFWLFMEYCPLGDLDHYLLKNCDTLTFTDKLHLMVQCVSGIAFMHSFEPPMVHRDIKPKNYLIVCNADNAITVKATDFGVAKLLEKTGGTVYAKSLVMKTFVGSPAFMAPELFEMDKELSYSYTVDIFSLGLVLQVLLKFSPQNKVTYPQLEGLHMKFITVGQTFKDNMDNGMKIPDIIKDVEDDSTQVRKIKEIIRNMTNVDPKRRPQLWVIEEELRQILSYAEVCERGQEEEESSEESSESEDEDIHDGSGYQKDNTPTDSNAANIDPRKVSSKMTADDMLRTPIKHPMYAVSDINKFNKLEDIMQKVKEQMELNNPETEKSGKPTKPFKKPGPPPASAMKPQEPKSIPKPALKPKKPDPIPKPAFKPQETDPIPKPAFKPREPEPIPKPAFKPVFKAQGSEDRGMPQAGVKVNTPVDKREAWGEVSRPTIDKNTSPDKKPPDVKPKPAVAKPTPQTIAEEFDPDDMLLTHKPVNRKPGQLDKRRLDDFEKRPSVKEKPKHFHAKPDELTEEEKREIYDVTNFGDFTKLADIMARFNKK